jgi:hypothetical protein
MSGTYVISLVENQLPRIIQGTKGTKYLTIHDLNGDDVDLDVFDAITLVCKNYPEEDESITRICSVSADDDTDCYFAWTEEQSAAWLAAPYYAEITLKRYVRDAELANSASGYIPEKHFMTISNCTVDFEVGDVITGALSGTTATVYAVDIYGGEGELELIKPSGSFTDGEAITAPGGGAAEVVVGISSSEYIADRFADDSRDFVALGVAADDEITIGSDTYVVEGYDSVASDWLVTTEENGSPGSGISYTIDTFDPATSATDYLYKTLPFVLYIDESLA